MKNKYINVDLCKLCESKKLFKAIELSKLPIGDKYTSKENVEESKDLYALDIMMCEDCKHYQNSVAVNPELIYNFYLSRPATTNPVLSDLFKEYANYLVDNFGDDKSLFAVEAGSNDGAFINYMQQGLKVKVLGVEPSPNLSKQANENNILTIKNFFTLELAKEIKKKHGAANFFIANHTFSNIVDLPNFVEGVKHLLKPNGVFSMQTHYHKSVIEKNLIENFTHEHLSGFYLKPLKSFFEKQNMEVFDAKLVAAKSGSIRCFVQNKNGPNKVTAAVNDIIKEEENFLMDQKSRHESIRDFIKSIKEQIHNFIDPLTKNNKKVAAFGTSIGATTFCFNYDLGKSISFFLDDDKYRHNLLSPHYNIPVLPPSEIYNLKPAAIIILAPLYADIIIKKNIKYLEEGGVFIKIWPKFEIVKK